MKVTVLETMTSLNPTTKMGALGTSLNQGDQWKKASKPSGDNDHDDTSEDDPRATLEASG